MDRVQSMAKHNYMWNPKVDDEKGTEPLSQFQESVRKIPVKCWNMPVVIAQHQHSLCLP